MPNAFLNPLEEKLAAHIQKNGAITVADFMATALYDKTHGYYTTQNPFTDFTTAPEITPLFGEVIAVWIVTTWQRMSQQTGHNAFTLLECGPGRGTLMSDVLRTLKKIAPDVHRAATVHMLETSPTLTSIQQETLQDHTVAWHKNITEVPNERPVILIANEFLDAFPIEQYVKINNTWQERCVNYTPEKNFHFSEQKTAINTQIFPADNDFYETSTAQDSWLNALQNHFVNVPLQTLFIDYAIAGGNTLQALKNHEFTPVLENMGQADLTAHVNFERLAQNLPNAQITDMSTFLTQYGLPLRLNGLIDNASPELKEELIRVAERLLSPEHMGALFKCLTHHQFG